MAQGQEWDRISSSTMDVPEKRVIQLSSVQWATEIEWKRKPHELKGWIGILEQLSNL